MNLYSYLILCTFKEQRRVCALPPEMGKTEGKWMVRIEQASVLHGLRVVRECVRQCARGCTRMRASVHARVCAAVCTDACVRPSVSIN